MILFKRQSRIVRGSLAAVIFRVLLTLLVAVQIALLTRYLSIGEYGVWASLSIIGSLSMLAVGAGAQLCNKLSASGSPGEIPEAEKEELFLAAFSTIFWLVVAVIALLLLVHRFIPWQLLINGSDARLFGLARSAFLACLVLQLLGLPFVIGSFAMRANHENGAVAAIGPAATLFCLLLLLLFIKAGKIGLIYIAPFLAWSLVYCASFFILLHRRGWKFKIFPFKKSWTLFSPYHAGSIQFSAFALSFALITVNMPYYAGLAQGFQSAGKLYLYFKVYLVMLAAIADMLQPLWPAYSSHHSCSEFSWMRRSLKTSIIVSMLLALSGSLLARFLGPWLVMSLTGRAIVIDDRSFLLLSLWLLLCSVAHALQVFLNACNVVKPQLIVSIAVLVPLPLLCRLAGATFGIDGPIMVHILGLGVILVVMVVKTVQELRPLTSLADGH